MPRGREPLRRRTPKRELWRLQKQRQRARRKVRDATRAEQARLRGEQIVYLNSQGLVVMRLQQTLRVQTDHHEEMSFPAGTEAWTRPGDVSNLERRGWATPVPVKTAYGVRIITGRNPDAFETEPYEPPRPRTAAGY